MIGKVFIGRLRRLSTAAGVFMSLDESIALALRREIYADGAARKADLLRLIDMGRVAGGGAAPAFGDLMAEVARDVLVNQVDPPNYIQQVDADWLVARLAEDGGLASRAEYDMLTGVIRKAVSVPPSLAAFALAQIERAIISGAAEHSAGVVSPEDLDALRTVVYAATRGSSLHVTRESAEALFRIADALVSASDPGFEEFFAKAIGNYLMGIAFRWTPSAEESRKADDWLDAPNAGLGEFVAAMFDFSRLSREVDRDALQNAVDARDRAQAERIDAHEADWLIARLYRDGAISAAEKRLLRFLRDESPSIAPALAALIETAA